MTAYRKIRMKTLAFVLVAACLAVAVSGTAYSYLHTPYEKLPEHIQKDRDNLYNANMDFIRYWGYDIQGAIYQEIVRQNTGKKIPFYIAAASKEPTTDIQVIHVWDQFLNQAMDYVGNHIRRVHDVKLGNEKPERCGVCDYCLETKVIHEPISLLDLDQQQLI